MNARRLADRAGAPRLEPTGALARYRDSQAQEPTVQTLQTSPAGPNDPDAIAGLLRHPRFPEAMRHIGSRFLLLHSDYFANQQVADEGRFLVCHIAMALHADYRPDEPDSGLTLARLVRRCADSRLMPHGRVEATVAILRRSRRLIDAPPGQDRRVRRMVPGPLLIGEFTQRVRFHFEALDMVLPGRPWLGLLETVPAFFWAVERGRGIYFAERSTLLQRLPAMKTIGEIEAGYLAMVALMDAMEGPPRAGEVAFPHAEVADRLSLPRAQLRRALGALEGAGLIRALASGGRSIEILPLAIDTMATWHAIRLLRFDDGAARAAATLGLSSRPDPEGAG